MINLEINYWSTIINIILQKYFSDLTTTCVLWPRDFDFNLPQSINNNVYLSINPLTLNSSFSSDIYDFQAQDESFNKDGVYYDDLVKRFIAAIAQANCEGFVAFQDDIPQFAETFHKASVYSIWRSEYNRFLFVINKAKQKEDYFQHIFFKNHPNILIIEAEFTNSSLFSIKTNKFVGSILKHPENLIHLTTFNALTTTFDPNIELFSQDKLQNLQGREIIVGALDYPPFSAVDFERLPQYSDHSKDNPKHLAHVDGSEIRICHIFCEMYNCSVQFDTSERSEWGSAYANFSASSLLGLLADGQVEMTMGAFCYWYDTYKIAGMTTFLGLSSITCLVPKPALLVTWTLPLRPFKLNLWLGVLFSLLLEMFCLLLGRYYEKYLQRQPNSWLSSLKFGFVSSLKLFINQGTSYVVSSHTLRTLLFGFYMLDILITSIYGGGLSSILTLPAYEEAADSVEKLYRHNLTWSGASPDWINLFSVEDDLILRNIFSNYKLFTKEQMRDKAQSENMGFVMERLFFGHFANADFLTPAALNRLKLMVDDLFNGYTIAMVPRTWAHLPKFNNLIMAWHSSGLDKFWEWKITAEYLNVQEQNQVESSRHLSHDNGPVKLGMQNFGGLIIIWLIGMTTSLLVFVGELLMFQWNGQMGKKTKFQNTKQKF